MMKYIAVALVATLATVVADDIITETAKIPAPQGYVVEQSYDGYLVPTEEDVFPGLPTATGVVSLKLTLLSLAGKAIIWFINNLWAIALGIGATFTFCKITSVCDLAYKKYPEVEQLRSLITPARLNSASEFITQAVEKYARLQKAESS